MAKLGVSTSARLLLSGLPDVVETRRGRAQCDSVPRRAATELIAWPASSIEPPIAFDIEKSFDHTAILGEAPALAIRLVAAPAVGRFIPGVISPGSEIRSGQVIGSVVLKRLVPIQSPFTGVFAGYLAVVSERVRVGQGVAWIRIGNLAV